MNYFYKTLSLSTFLLTLVAAQYPLSREAKIIEQVSPTEVMVEATGEYKGSGKNDKSKKKDVKNNGLRRAIHDSKRAAIHHLLFSGTDPILQSNDEKMKFDNFSSKDNYFFDSKNLNLFISFEEQDLRKRLSTDGGKGLKVVKRYKINIEKLKNDLISRELISSLADLTDSIGNPFIMVLPRVDKGQSPIEFLASDDYASHAASVVQSYLTANQYEVVVPDQAASLEAMNSAQMDVKERDEDIAYQLALAIGSDVYIDYKGSFEDAGYGTQRYALEARAYETTTARLLGSETGYSQGRSGDQKVSIEEAMNDAIAKVLSRVNQYWKKDLKNGIQYKLVFSLAASDFDEDDLEEVQFSLMDIIDEISNKSKENIVTDNTIDYLIWCNPEDFDKSTKVYRSLRRGFKDTADDYGAKLGRININRKMILLKVDSE